MATIATRPSQPAERATISNPWVRRTALMASFLLSGGLLLFPRLPLLGFLVVLCFVDRGGRLTINPRMTGAWVWLAAVALLTLVRPGGVDVAASATRFANFAGAMALLRMYLEAPRDALAADLRAVLPWLSIQAVLTVVFGLFFSILAFPLNIDGATYTTFMLLFTWHETIATSSLLVRPDGFFFEPGVFQIFLNIHLFVSLFPRRDWRQAALATAAVLATQSTTGLIIALAQFAVVTWPVLSRGDALQRSFKFISMAIIVVPLVIATATNVEEKFFGASRGSAWARQYDLLTGINIVSAYPLTGIGFDHARYTALAGQFGFSDTDLSPDSLDDRTSSNGLIQVLYSVGLLFAAPWLIGLFRNSTLRPAWLFGILLILALNGEALAFTPFFAMFALGGMMRRPLATQST